MAGILSSSWLPSPVPLPRRRTHRFDSFRCCSGAPDSSNKDKPTPQLLKIAVSGATEFLRLFSSAGDTDYKLASCDDGPPASGIDDIVMTLKSDYENAYFVTGIFTSAIYAEDCIFEDPTIKFRGRDLYSRNLKLLVPFFEQPSISLQSIEKVLSSQSECVLASWKLSISLYEETTGPYFGTSVWALWMHADSYTTMVTEYPAYSLFVVRPMHSTYLKLPWKPLISIEGSTIYDLDNQYKIVRHVESWNVSPLEAVGQIFKPSFGRPVE